MSDSIDPRAAWRPDATAVLASLMRERILVLDGAMGTAIQRDRPDEAGYRGERFADWPSDLVGNNDLLTLTRPEVIAGIHREYLAAGADIVETNTFNANAVSLADYGLEAFAYELNVAGARVARAAADGHTLLLASNETMVLTPNYATEVGYDPTRQFELAAPLVNMPFVLMTNTGLPFKTLDRLISHIKVRPGEVNYGSSGEGSTGHLAGELLRRAAGLDMVHVSYNGGLSALNGLATGQTSLMFAALPLALPYLNNEHLRALAVAGTRRAEMLPHLPTLSEAGIAGADVAAWFGIFVPNGVSPNTIRWLNEHISASVNDTATRDALLLLGLEPVRGTLSDFASRIYAEGERWGPVLKAARIPSRAGRGNT